MAGNNTRLNLSRKYVGKGRDTSSFVTGPPTQIIRPTPVTPYKRTVNNTPLSNFFTIGEGKWPAVCEVGEGIVELAAMVVVGDVLPARSVSSLPKLEVNCE